MNQTQIFNDALHSFSLHYNQLRDKPEETSENTIKALWFSAADQAGAIENVISKRLPELSASQITCFNTLVQQRISGVPLAHLTGKQLFMGIEFTVSSKALVPRKETEIVGNAALQCIRGKISKNAQTTVIDVCTGCGNLALAYAFHEPMCKVYASDLSPDAIELAVMNAKQLHLEKRITFKVGDLLGPFDEPAFLKSVDVISCNPPYISTTKLSSLSTEIIGYEPELAFNGGPFGITIMNKMIQQAPKFLAEGGWLYMEVGEGQGNGVLQLLKKGGFFKHIEPLFDNKNIIRAIGAGI